MRIPAPGRPPAPGDGEWLPLWAVSPWPPKIGHVAYLDLDDVNYWRTSLVTAFRPVDAATIDDGFWGQVADTHRRLNEDGGNSDESGVEW